MILRDIIKKNLLLEKRIAQLTANVEIVLGLDLIKTKHTLDQMKMSSREDVIHTRNYDISNREMVEFVNNFTTEIAEGIINDEIHDGVPFVLKSRDWKLAMAIAPHHVAGTYWKLVIITVFPESEYNSFRVGKDQLVLEL